MFKDIAKRIRRESLLGTLEDSLRGGYKIPGMAVPAYRVRVDDADPKKDMKLIQPKDVREIIASLPRGRELKIFIGDSEEAARFSMDTWERTG